MSTGAPALGLSFLGTGRYAPTTYVFEGRAAPATRYVCATLPTFFDLDDLLVITTPEARAAHGEALAAECAVREVPIPSGRSETEWWVMFNAIAEAVPEGARLVIDITHGFRSQPLLALAVALYLRAAKGVAVDRIVYGAYEARDVEAGRTPVFDLTAVLRLIDWATATEQFVERGDARPLRALFDAVAREGRSQAFVPLKLAGAAEHLGALTTALALNRPLEAAREARALPEALVGAYRDATQVPQGRPVQWLVRRVARRFEALAAAGGDLFSPEGFTAQAELIRYYLRTEQVMQALTLASEALLSKRCVLRGADPLDRGARQEARDDLHDLHARFGAYERTLKAHGEVTEELADDEKWLAVFWHEANQLRNDVAHAGMNRDPAPARDLAARASELLHEVAWYLAT
jgi:CRISPR-associated DxTHG motif protein